MQLLKASSLFPVAAALCVVGQPLHAQTNPPAQQAPQSSSAEEKKPEAQSTPKLDAITVTGVRQKATATRQDAQLLDLPQSVTVIPEQLIQDRAYTRIEELANTVPNLQANTPYYGGISEGFYSRGFTDSRTLIDGYAAGSDGIFNLALIDKAEVLRGPASVLYGQGNPGGVVNLTLKRPLKEAGFSAALLGDSNGTRQLEFDWNQPLANTLSLRLVGALEDSTSFREFVKTKRTQIAPALRWTPDAATTLDVLYQKTIYKSPYDEGFPTSSTSSYAIRNVPIERSYLEPWAPLRRTDFDNLRIEASHQLNAQWNLAAAYFSNNNKVVDAFGSLQLAYDAYDEVTGVLPRVVRGEYPTDQNYAKYNTLTLRARGDFLLAGVRNQVVLGLERSRSDFVYNVYQSDVDPINLFNPVYGIATPRIATDFSFAGGSGSRTDAAYVNNLITLAPQWKVQLGLRYDRIISDAYSDAQRTLSDSSRFSRFTPSVGAVWQPNRTTSVYANYTSSFVPLPYRNRFNEVLDPETGKSIELGVKQELMNGKVALTAAAFVIDKDGILQTDPNDNFFSVNGGKARSKGIEVEVQGKPTSNLELVAGIGVADAKWVRSTDFPIGERLPGPSAVTAAVSIKHKPRLAWLPSDAWWLAAANYGSEREWIAPANPYKLPAYTRIDLGAGAAVTQNTELQFNIKNVTDARILSANGYGIVIPEAPRTYAITLRVRTGSL